MAYKSTQNYENLQKAIFEGAGRYQIPVIAPVQYGTCEWIGFNYALQAKNRESKGVHFFLDDYQFNRIWTNVDRYTELLMKFAYVMSPDYSLSADFPLATQIYNHYRKHWLAAYWQQYGIKVIPTICWSDRASYEWCFDGEPVNSTIAVSAIGTQNSREKKRLFLDGYEAMMDRLRPEKIIFYGRVPDECKGNIVRIKSFCEKFHEAEVAQW